MAISKYKKKSASGNIKEFYMVSAEAINKFTGLRHQKRRRGISSRPKAEKVYKELWNLCLNEKPNIPQPKTWIELKILFYGDLIKKVRSEENPDGISPRTFDIKKSYLERSYGWDLKHPSLITPNQAKEDLEDLLKCGIITQLIYRKTLQLNKEVFQFAVESGIYENNPYSQIKVKRQRIKKRKLALTHEEANHLINEAQKRRHPYYFVWVLALTTGMRRSELAGLRWTDLDLENGLIYLQRQKLPFEGVVDKTKTGEDRVVAIPKVLIPLLLRKKLESESPFIIDLECSLWKKGRQAQVTKEFCKEIGITAVTFHQLRATHITLAIVDNISLGIVKENVGHSRLSTTDIYFRSSGINMKGKTDGLNIKIPLEEEAKVISLS